jgi:hypothetical protein
MKHLRMTPAVLFMTLMAAVFSPTAKADGWNNGLKPLELGDPSNAAESALAPFGVVSAVRSIGSAPSGNEPFAAAFTLSLTLSLMGAIALGAGIFRHNRRANKLKSSSWSRFQTEQSRTKGWSEARDWRGATGSSYRVSAERSLPSRG